MFLHTVHIHTHTCIYGLSICRPRRADLQICDGGMPIDRSIALWRATSPSLALNLVSPSNDRARGLDNALDLTRGALVRRRDGHGLSHSFGDAATLQILRPLWLHKQGADMIVST